MGLNEQIQASPRAHAKFLLKYAGLLIGGLSIQYGRWLFEYSDDFRRNEVLRPIVEFPDINRTYEGRELWQFFASRIPSPARAEVAEILEREY
jgi:hypothetical protein